jgi:hypothetical protein
MKLNRAAAGIATVAIASAAIVSGCGVTHHSAIPAPHQVSVHQVTAHLTSAHRTPAAPADRPLAWLESAGGQAQVTVNDEIDTLAAALQTEAHAPTVANHLIFEADSRVVRAQARTILSTPALLPAHNRAAYQAMLTDFVTVANLLQPGADYGTTPQDYVAWYQALHASNVTVY